ncbi:hypothetical protein KM295_07395 [Natronomonas sp. F2-12]|uniref:Uncharacterized protein n=1 Tax=Natronomonas aquatica TaxID=2841590 RepID=A0A9R1CT30_9EURY|nr:hypothetical protein [Natronomonas aquatica]MCQ4333303.1 hypothetical protein [Natronomonas aquatica]
MSDYTIYIDALPEGDWFQSLSSQLKGAELVKLQSAEAPPVVKELTSYDRPDIILLRDGDPVLVLEKTGHVPTGKNPLQRVARMVKAAEMGVTGVFFTPYEAMKHGTHSGRCNANYRLIESLRRIGEVHNVEMLIPPWPSDNEYELIRDGSEDELVGAFVDQFLTNDCDPNVPAANKIRKRTQEEVERILNEHPPYERPPRSVDIADTDDYLGRIRGKLNRRPPDPLPKRSESVVCTFDMSPSSCRRVDPYGGAQFVYDYLYCRTGPSRSERRRNLVLQIPRVPKETWLDKNPYKPQNKSSLWYKCADAIELEDAVLTDLEQYRQS